MTEDIALVGTTAFFENYSNTSPGQKVEDMREWCEDQWDYHMAEDSFWYAVDRSVIEVPTPSSSDMCERLQESKSWLQDNYDDYSFYDAIVVLDYWESSSGVVGQASAIGGAGQYDYKVAKVNMDYEDDGELAGTHLEDVQSKGTAWHEAGHLYCARHTDPRTIAEYYTGDCRGTLMYSPASSNFCSTECSSVDTTAANTSDCTTTTVDCFSQNGKDPDECSSCDPYYPSGC